MNQKLKVKVKNGPSGKSQVISGDSKEQVCALEAQRNSANSEF